MSEPGRRSLKLGGAIAALCVVGIVGFGIATRVRSDDKLAAWTQAQATPTVAIIRPTIVKEGEMLTIPANIQAYNSAPIYARTTGYIRRWYVDIGDSVRAGQLLALLDAPEIDQQLAAARADLQTARANQQLARSTAARWTNMLAKDAVSKQETDEKIGDLAAKSAVANAASANVARLQALQNFTRLVAPFDGVITSRSTQIGALVSAGTAAATPLFTVSDVSRMRVFVHVPQAVSAKVHPGLHVTLSLPEYPGRSFDAVMTRSSGAVDPGSGTVLVELGAANGERALKPGAYAQARFPLQAATGAITLPASALIIGQGGTQVALLGADGKAHLKTIIIGRDQGDIVEVNAGLSLADRVIDSPPDSLQSGDPVQIAHNEPKASDAKH